MVKEIKKQELEEKKEPQLEEKIVEISRVARVMAGGRRFRFRILVVVGDKAGHVGFGLAKAGDLPKAILKAKKAASKRMIKVPIKNETIPHLIEATFGSAHVILKPASRGTGIIAGGAVRAVIELSGIKNILSKIIGSPNKVNNVKATLLALSKLKR